MASADAPSFGRRWRAPRADRAFLADPSLAQAASLVDRNRALLAERSASDSQGVPWGDLAREARQELSSAARAYSSTYLDPAPQPTDGPFILAGHQPGMFHAGVWCKNFLISSLAREFGGTAINIVVNTDTLRQPTLRVPAGVPGSPHWETIPFDEATEEMPFEERRIIDAELFNSFGQRAQTAMRALVPNSLLDRYWPQAVERAQATRNLGQALAESRHWLERAWGLTTWEVPWSTVLELPAARRLTAQLLSDACRLRVHYNEAILAYRRAYRVRSRNHPAPLLELNGDWCEAPYRVWRSDSPRRQRLFVQRQGNELRLTDRAGWMATIPAPRDVQDQRAIEALADLAQQGVKIRTRALATTLYARLLFADLFVHGIGGGLYDQVTDRWMWQAWRINPPAYLVATATLFLPLAGADKALNSPPGRAVLRDLLYHPEQFISPLEAPPEAREAIDVKRRWVAAEQTRENARERCRAIRNANETLQPFLTEVRKRMTAEADERDRRRAADQVARWREYGFPLYPERFLRDFLLEIPTRNV